MWVYCGAAGGCAGEQTKGDCWLKEHKDLNVREPQAQRHPGATFVPLRCSPASFGLKVLVRIDADAHPNIPKTDSMYEAVRVLVR